MDNLTTQMMMQKYGFTMTPEQLAETLGLAYDTVCYMLKRKEITARKQGNKWIISTEKAAEYITSTEEPKEPRCNGRKGQKIIV